MTSTAARACYRLTVAVLRWTWRAILALFALTVAVAAGLGVTAAIRHRRTVRAALPAAQAVLALDAPTVVIPVVRTGRHAA